MTTMVKGITPENVSVVPDPTPAIIVRQERNNAWARPYIENRNKIKTLAYDPDYFGRDPKRLWTGITLCIEADGDSEYKSAVQELNIQLAL